MEIKRVAIGVYDLTGMDESFIITIYEGLKGRRDELLQAMWDARSYEARGLTHKQVTAEIRMKKYSVHQTAAQQEESRVSSSPYQASEDLTYLSLQLNMVAECMFQIEQAGIM